MCAVRVRLLCVCVCVSVCLFVSVSACLLRTNHDLHARIQAIGGRVQRWHSIVVNPASDSTCVDTVRGAPMRVASLQGYRHRRVLGGWAASCDVSPTTERDREREREGEGGEGWHSVAVSY